MRILLKDLTTGNYFVRPGEWTSLPEAAYSFKTGDNAIDMALQQGVAEGALFYHFSDPKQNFFVPIG
jgi:hypothetical protein